MGDQIGSPILRPAFRAICQSHRADRTVAIGKYALMAVRYVETHEPCVSTYADGAWILHHNAVATMNARW